MLNKINNGIAAEDKVFLFLHRFFRDIRIKRSRGVDLEIYGGLKPIKIEVKSAHYLVKNGKYKHRKGKFYFYRKNLNRPDFYFFLIYQADLERVYFVNAKEIKTYCQNLKAERISLSIPAFIRNIKKLDLSEVFKRDASM